MPRATLVALVALVALAGCAGGPGGSIRKEVGSPGPAAATPRQGESIGASAVAQGGVGSLTLSSGTGASGHEARMTGPLRAYAVQTDAPVKLDGVLKEWPARSPAEHVVRGAPRKGTFSVALQYDDARVYVAAEVADATFVRTPRFAADEDHVSFVLAFPDGGRLSAHEIGLFAGKPGESAGAVRFLAGPQKGEDVPGAKIVEAPTQGGYTIEATIPWATFPEAATLRVGLRGVLRSQDAEAGGVKHVVATGPGEHATPASLPALPTEPEQAVVEGLLAPKGLSKEAPHVDLFVDVAGDAMKERVSVFGRYFTVCGPSYRGGKQFFFRDLGADLLRLEAKDVSGRGKAELLVSRRAPRAGGGRDWFEVWGFRGDEPETIFSHETAVTSGDRKVTNSLRVSRGEVEVHVEGAVGWDAASFSEPTSADAEPLLVPWGAVKSRVYRFDGSRFQKAREVAQTPEPPPGVKSPGTAPRPARPEDVPTPPVKKAADLGGQIFAQYKKDQSVPPTLAPKVELEVQLAEDPRPEKVVLIGRDIVVWGPGFRNGSAYAFLTLAQFASADDIDGMTARDLNGDGNADLVVRGKRQAQGGADPVTIEAMFVYELRDGRLVRTFAIETAREQGAKRVQGLVQFVPAKGGKSLEIDVRPGVAKGWTKESYPWPQEPSGGAIEPLLLPWGGSKGVRYTYVGDRFAPSNP